MKSWNPEALEAALASQGIRLAPGRAAKIAAGLNAPVDFSVEACRERIARRQPRINAFNRVEEEPWDFEVSSWNGLLAPAKTPPEIVARLNREFVRTLATADVREKFAAQAAEPVGNTPEQFRAYIKAEIDKWAQVVKASGAKID